MEKNIVTYLLHGIAANWKAGVMFLSRWVLSMGVMSVRGSVRHPVSVRMPSDIY